MEYPFLPEQSLYQINLFPLISVKVSTCRKERLKKRKRFLQGVRLNYATTHHHLPPSDTTHHHPPPAKIYPPPPTTTYHHPPPPTTISQNISTTIHHHSLTAKIYHHQPQSKIYPSEKEFYKKNIKNILKYFIFKSN